MFAWVLTVALLFAARSANAAVTLPDARAFEQATPTEKGGAPAQGNYFIHQAAADGNGVLFLSLSAFPGAEGSQDFGTFLSQRAQNWSTEGLLPPASIGRAGKFISVSEDLRYSYVASDLTQHTASLFQRDNSTGSLTKVFTTGFFVEPTGPVQTSSDGQRVIFESEDALVAGAAVGRNVYLWNRATGSIELAAVLNNGEAPAPGAFPGPYKWRTAEPFQGGVGNGLYAANLAAPNDARTLYFTEAQNSKLFVRINVGSPQSGLNGNEECLDLNVACTFWASRPRRSPPDPNGEKPAIFFSASQVGPRSVLFGSSGKLTNDATTGPTDEGRDLYVYYVDEDRLEDLVPDSEDPQGADVQGVLGTSADGTVVYFAANGVLGDGEARGATLGNCISREEGSSTTGECNLYAWQKNTGIRFIARLSANGLLSNPSNDATNWVPSATGSPAEQPTSRVSRDGNALLFSSSLNLDPAYDNRGIAQFYRYQLDTNELVCVSCSSTAASPLYPPTFTSIQAFASPKSHYNPLPRTFSSNGNRAIFESADSLVAADVNGQSGCPLTAQPAVKVPKCQDVYEWEAAGEGSCSVATGKTGCIYLISSGTSTEPAYLSDADSEANNIFFYTNTSLVGQDRDQLTDIYDARVGGGIPGQNPVPPFICQSTGECSPAASTPLAEDPPASLSFHQRKKRAQCHPRKPSMHRARQRKHRAKQGKCKPRPHRKRPHKPRSEREHGKQSIQITDQPKTSGGLLNDNR